MDLRPLGSTGLLVSPIGLGAVKLGRNRGVKYPEAQRAELPSDDQIDRLLTKAADLGVNLIDTAPAYGTSEERLGQAMARLDWLGGRDHWVICTKAGEEFNNDTGESRFDFSPGAIKTSVERSLRRLHIDVLDLVLLHCDEREEWIIAESGAPETLRELVHRGHIRAWGMSSKTVDGSLMGVRQSHGACDVVMLSYNPMTRQEAYAIDAAAHRGVGILVKKALGSGHLEDLWSKIPTEFRQAAAAEAGKASVSGSPNIVVEAAMRFVLARRGVSSVVVGTLSPEHLASNVVAAERAGAGR